MKYFLSIFILAISGWLIAANVHDLSVDSNGNMTAITKGGEVWPKTTSGSWVFDTTNKVSYHISKSSDVVVISTYVDTTTTTNANSGTNASLFIPSEFRPFKNVVNVSDLTASNNVGKVTVLTTGSILLEGLVVDPVGVGGQLNNNQLYTITYTVSSF